METIQQQIKFYTERLGILKDNRAKEDSVLTDEGARSFDEQIRMTAEFIHVLKKLAAPANRKEVIEILTCMAIPTDNRSTYKHLGKEKEAIPTMILCADANQKIYEAIEPFLRRDGVLVEEVAGRDLKWGSEIHTDNGWCKPNNAEIDILNKDILSKSTKFLVKI